MVEKCMCGAPIPEWGLFLCPACYEYALEIEDSEWPDGLSSLGD